MTSLNDCEHWRGQLALEAVGHVDVASHGDLLKHLDECALCHSEAIELAQAAGTLALVDPEVAELIGQSGEVIVDDGRTSSLDAPFAGVLASGGEPREARLPRFPRRLIASVLAVAVAALVVVGAISLSGHGANGSHTLTLVGSQGSRATAVLTPEAWGTSVALSGPAERSSQILNVSMTTVWGRPWAVGSYRATTAHGVTVTLACALPLNQIRSISVTDASGHVVLASH